MKNNQPLILDSNLQPFFFDQLTSANQKSSYHIPKEMLFYLSLVLEKNNSTSQFFEVVDGKIRDKILGIKLLEATHLPKEKKKAVLKDVGETSLLLCGYFYDSMSKKQVSLKYYQDLGIMAYEQLNNFIPNVYDTPNFFKKFARNYRSITDLLTVVAKELHSDKDAFLIISSSHRKAS